MKNINLVAKLNSLILQSLITRGKNFLVDFKNLFFTKDFDINHYIPMFYTIYRIFQK